MNSEPDREHDAGIGRDDDNDMQRAIRQRALHNIRRKPAPFWYSTPARLVLAVVLAIVFVTLLAFGMDRFLRAFNHIIRIYVMQPASSPQPPTGTATDSGVIYVTPGAVPESPPPHTLEPSENAAK